MKQLVCEMCGSTDLVKDNGLFICQSCGCKYTVEEAKKMMIEGTVDVSGSTIKIDNAAKLENLRQLAERAKEENDSKTATKYFEQILMEDPNDWEANFYTIYYAAHNIKIAEIGSAANRVSNIIEPVFKLIKKNIADGEQQKKAYTEVSSKIMDFALLLLHNANENLGSTFETIQKNRNAWHLQIYTMLTVLGDQLISKFQAYDEADSIYKLVESGTSIKPTTADIEKLYNLIINRRRVEIPKLIQSVKKERRERYWEEHVREKEILDSENASLQKQLDEMEAKIMNLPEKQMERSIQETLKAKRKEKDSLGIFKIKEKRIVQEEIENLTKQLSAAREAGNRSAEPFIAQIKDIKERISWIQEELFKDR